jgi:hypothetical protein
MVPGVTIFKESWEVRYLLAWAWSIRTGSAVVCAYCFDSTAFLDDAMELMSFLISVLACNGDENEDGGE